MFSELPESLRSLIVLLVAVMWLWGEKAPIINPVVPNSYVVELVGDYKLRKNRRNMFKTQEQFVPAQKEDNTEIKWLIKSTHRG